MAAAPDLETLHDFEGQIEPALAAQLTLRGIGEVDLQRGTGDRHSGRVDVELTMGAATGHLYIPANLPDGTVGTEHYFEDAWNAILALNIVTSRDINGALHAAYRAKVRTLMQQRAQIFTSEVLPYHAFAQVRNAGTTVGLITNKDEDYSQIRYACVISIRRGAWPAPY